MSKYTVELRELLEQGVDIGLKDYPIWKEDHRQELNQKIINHYKYREIGFETPGRFIDELNIKMNEIMPYYNELYKTTMFEYNPIHNVDYTEEYETKRDTTGSSETTGNATGKDTTTSEGSESVNGSSQSTTTNDLTTSTNHKNTKVDIDTPQSNVDVDNITSTYPYASNVSQDKNDETSTKNNKDTTSGSGTSKTESSSEVTNDSESSSEVNTNRTENQTETHSKHLVGNYGMTSSQTLIRQERELIINIDMQIIGQLRGLFMQVW